MLSPMRRAWGACERMRSERPVVPWNRQMSQRQPSYRLRR